MTEEEKIPLVLIKQFVDDVLRQKGKLTQEIFLGGSMSPLDPKQPHAESDIDLFVIVKNIDETICPKLSQDECLQEEVLWFGETLVVITPIFNEMFIEERSKWIKL